MELKIADLQGRYEESPGESLRSLGHFVSRPQHAKGAEWAKKLAEIDKNGELEDLQVFLERLAWRVRSHIKQHERHGS